MSAVTPQQPRLALVTGATRGLGLAIARHLQQAGYRVVGAGRNSSDALMQLCAPAQPDLIPLVYRKLDLGLHHTLGEFVMDLHREYGPLYGLVNNAAIAHDGVLATLHQSQIEETIQVNVTGTILLTKAALRSMLVGRHGGRIINVSSIVSQTGFNGLSVYGASKAALNGFTRSLAREVGRMGITVNTVAPGYMATDMSAGLDSEQLESIKRRSPMRELTQPADVAAIVAFLMSDAAQRVTGATMTVDAGSTA